MKAVLWIVAVVLCVLAIMAVAGFAIQASPEGRDRIATQAAIEHCRDLQNDELESIETRRVMRSVCNGMTARYREKWNRDP